MRISNSVLAAGKPWVDSPCSEWRSPRHPGGARPCGDPARWRHLPEAGLLAVRAPFVRPTPTYRTARGCSGVTPCAYTPVRRHEAVRRGIVRGPGCGSLSSGPGLRAGGAERWWRGRISASRCRRLHLPSPGPRGAFTRRCHPWPIGGIGCAKWSMTRTAGARPARPCRCGTSGRSHCGPGGRPPTSGCAETRAAVGGRTPARHRTVNDGVPPWAIECTFAEAREYLGTGQAQFLAARAVEWTFRPVLPHDHRPLARAARAPPRRLGRALSPITVARHQGRAVLR